MSTSESPPATGGPPLHYPLPRLNANLIAITMLIVVIYVYWTLEDTERLQRQLTVERGQRLRADQLAESRQRDLDGALEKIHELRNGSGDDGDA